MKIVTKHPLVFAVSLMATVAAGWGCKNFLENASEPLGTLDQNTLLNKAGVEGSLLSAYRILDCTSQFSPDWGCAASNWVWGSVASDDAYKGSEATDQPPIDDIEQYHWATGKAEDYLNTKWRGVYEGVNRANATLRLLKQVQEAKPGEIDDETAKGIQGEAIFLRAHYHFEAWRMWGNVPYYREDDTDFKKPNLQSEAVVTEILKDLREAETLLPKGGPRNGQKGRADYWTARAYEGRLLVYTGQFAGPDGALTVLTEVRTAGPYALETSFDKVWTGYSDEANGKETIFAYQASANDGETNGNNANYGERLNFPHSGSPFGCCGFHQPSQNLVNFFRVDAAGLPLSLSDPTWNANNSNFTAANNTVPVDPRLDWTVGRDGVPYKDWGKHAASWIRAPAYGGTYSPKKNAHEKTSGAESSVGWVPTQLNSVNIHIFRYADLLLLLAEAEVEAGSPANAITIVNEIRARAGVKAQGPGVDASGAANRALIAVPINDPSITWATYRVGLYPAGLTQAQAREAVRTERRLELAMEGQRFFDLRRWGIAEQTLNDYLAVEKTRRPQLAAAEAFSARHRYYPIPAIQIELSKSNGQNTLVQNPGW